jgi:glycosyltransferase involved in cell wall biosynthesis
MRILQLISQTVLGGAESFGFSLGSELARRGHDVLLVANRLNGPLLERERPTGMNVRVLKRTSRLDPRIVPFLMSAIRDFRPHVIHSHNFTANTWARSLGCLHPRIVVVCHEHSGMKTRQKRRDQWLDRIQYPRCAAVFAVSEEIAEFLRRRHGLREPVLRVLLNGIEVDRYAIPADRDRDPLEAVCVASLFPVKNHGGLLRSWKLVMAACPGVRLVLVGDGPLRESLERSALDLGIAHGVVFAGLHQDVRPLLWRASLFLLASHREGMPLSLLEAMAAELPAVASAVGQIPSILNEGRCGVAVPAGDEKAFAEAICDLFQNRAKRDEMGRSGRDLVVRRYAMGPCVDAIERVYRMALRDVVKPTGKVR